MRHILEARFLFDASLALTAGTVHDIAGHESGGAHVDPLRGAVPAAVAEHAVAGQSGDLGLPATDRAGEAPAVAPTAVLFVDPRVSNWRTLAAGATAGTSVVVLDPAKDGLAQVGAALSGMSGVKEVDFLTYGSAGQIALGATAVDSAALIARGSDVAAWRDHLADGAQVQIWGCDAGAGVAGAAFVADLHNLLGVGVAASTDATGAAAMGGNWALERTSGSVAPVVPFSADAVAAYHNVLDTPVPTVTLSGMPAQVLLGDTFTETVSFQNTAATGVGYGPFVDVFVPQDAQEKATLTGASYLGASLVVTPVTLSTTVPGHAGTLGALHPLALDAAGAPLFVAAPAGTVAGDAMYVVQLPFGSYTPGQPAADIALSFTTDKTSALTSQHPGQNLSIAAIGGFEYGADPLNNPAADPSIRGTAGTAAITSSVDGLSTTAAPVTLVNVLANVITWPGENESATGLDFVEHYRVTLVPAPATTGNAISGLTVQIVLPGDVQYTGGAISVGGSPGVAGFTAAGTAQGGTVNVSIPTLSAGGGTSVIDIPVYVPRLDSGAAPILDPVTGAFTVINAPVSVYNSGTWTPWAGSVDAGHAVTVTGTASGTAQFTAKSLAMQATAVDLGTGGTAMRPGDSVQYTLKFQVSDYFNMGALTLQSLLGDGLTLDPSVAPSLALTPAGGTTTTISLGAISGTTASVNGQAVATSGANADWSYSRDNVTTGQTTVSLDAGAAMLAALGTTRLTAGETGSITFNAKVLDKYTNTNIDPTTGKPAFVTERDVATMSASATAQVLDTTGAATHAPVLTVTDTSGANLAVNSGVATVFIVAVNGTPVSGTVNLTAGDVVTYGITYNLVTGDYRDFNLSAYLPLPTLSVADPLAAGGSVGAFTLDGTAAAFPAAGQYKLVTPPGGVAVSSAAVDATANGITFAFGHRDDPTNAAGQSVTVLFSATASTAPFADGLFLTTQGRSEHTNGEGNTAIIDGIKQIHLEEPSLVGGLKVGIAALGNDALGGKTGGFTIDKTATAADPSGVYGPAGGAGTPFVAGSPTAVGALQDLNVTGADGSDTARVVMTLANVGSAPSGAYDVTLANLLPAGYAAADASHILFTRGDGTVLAVAGGSLFTAGGVTLEDPASTGGAPVPTLYAAGDALHRDVLTVSFDLKLKPGQTAGSVLTDSGSIVNYSNIFNGVALGNGFVVGGVPVGGNAASLTDTATITTTAPALAKTFGPSDIVVNDNTDAGFPNATVVVGETRPITITVKLPEGVINNGTADVFVQEVLPVGETFVSLGAITAGSGVTMSASGTPGISGQTVLFDLGPSLLNANADASGTVTITYNARFADGGNVDGSTFASTASLIYAGAPVPPATVTFVEHDPKLAATITDNSGGIIFSNQTLTYTYTVTNSGVVQAQATASVLKLPAGESYVPGSLVLVSKPGSPDSGATVNESGGGAGTLGVAPGVVDPGGSVVYTFQAVVSANLPAGTDLTVSAPTVGNDATSIVNGFARHYGFGATDPRTVQSFAPGLNIVGEANGTTSVSQVAPVTAAAVTVGDIVRLHGETQIPEGANTGVTLDFTLPAGFVPFTADGTVKLALASPSGKVTSSVVDPAGTTGGLQVVEGGTAINPLTYAPGFVVPAGAIDAVSVPGHLLIKLGDLVNNDASGVPNYAVVEFNGQAANVAGTVDGAVLGESLVVRANGAVTAAAAVSETVKEPHITLAKTVTAVNTVSNTVTYLLTVKNTGDAIAYNVNLTDPLPGNVAGTGAVVAAGGATGLVVTPGAGNVFAAGMTLAPGATETFSYTLTVNNPLAPVPVTTTSVTAQDINPAVTGLAGSAIGAVGGAAGSRDGSAMPGGGIDSYWAQVADSLGVASGKVWQALGAAPGTFDPALDTVLAGVSVTVTAAGSDGVFGTPDDLVQTVTTAPDGSYHVALLPAGAFKVTLPASGAGGLPAGETLVADALGSITTVPGTASATAAGGAVTGIDFAYEVPDVAPVLGNWASGVQVIAPGEVASLSTTFAATETDRELDTLVAAGGSYDGAVLTFQRYSGGVPTPNAADHFGGGPLFGFSGSSIVVRAALTDPFTILGTYTNVGGVLAITLAPGATSATVATILDQVTYSNPTVGTLSLNITIGATLADGNTNTVPLATGFTGLQGTGGIHTSAPVFTTFTLVPSTALYVATFIEPNNTPAAAAAITLPGVVLGDFLAPGATLSKVVVSIGGYTGTEDVLAASTGAATGNITASYDPAAGQLTLISPGATATIGQWQSALSALTYYDSVDQPQRFAITSPGTPRVVEYSLTDATTSATLRLRLGSIDVIAVNDSPVLDPAIAVTLPLSIEDALSAPSGAAGTLVGALANSANIADPDQNNANTSTFPGPDGVAIVSADTTRGNWWFSTNNGATWTEFAGAGLPAISATNGLHLAADGGTRIYFQPTIVNDNGAIVPALSYRAWDGADGLPNGSLAALPTDSALGTGVNTAASAYSAAIKQINVTIAPVNDAPVASGGTVLLATPEDSANPPGDTVSNLFAPAFTDTADQQHTVANPTGSVANLLAGVAVVANPTPPAEGTWRYSIDGGTTWVPIPTTLTDGSALILSAAAKIDFLPAPNFNGAPLPLTVRLIDGSTDVPLVGGTTGAGLLSGPQVLSGVDVSGPRDGGITAVSGGTVQLVTTVPPVNDAPVASGGATLAPVNSAQHNPPGDTVVNLFTPSYVDTVDGQKTPLNPTGSVPNPFAGVVVVGNPTPPVDGVWKYSPNGGTTWDPIPTTVTDTSGLVLGPNVRIAFFPNPNFHGPVPPLQVRLIDGSIDVPLSGPTTGAALVNTSTVITNVDVSGPRHGGITPVSTGLVPLDTTITPTPGPRPPSNVINPFGDSNRFTAPGGMPPGYLLGTTVYRSLVTDQVGIINVSADAFYGSGANQHLSYEARMASGASLPPWLTFDASTLNFRGVPPESATGTLDIKIIATTPAGMQATSEIHVFITRQPSDLLSLLRATRVNDSNLRPPAPVRAAPVRPTPPRPTPRPTAEVAVPFGLTAQLRDQTQAGRLARARTLLAAIADAAD